MESGTRFEYAQKMSVDELAEYFQKLADGFRYKSLELHGGGQTMALAPEDTVKLEVKAKNAESEGELELEVSWKREYTSRDEKLEITTCPSNEPADQ